MIRSANKVMATVFWDSLVFIDYMEKGENDIRRFHEELIKNHPELIKKKVLFNNDSTSGHSSVGATEKLVDLH